MPKYENYLVTFTPKELMEVILNPEDWHPSDVKEARKILKQKGVTKSDIADYKKRLEDRELKGERASMGVLALGFVSALLGGFLGIFIGIYMATSKKETSKGEQIFRYDEVSRKFGWAILACGALGTIVWVILYATR